jgi:uroporphyrinogen decarboxylase
MSARYSKEERVVRTIRRQPVDYLPSQLVFADRSRYGEISSALGLASESDLDGYLENHFFITFTLHDKPLMYRDVRDEIEKLKGKGYARPDWPHNVVYDEWGVGYKVGIGSFFVAFHPLQARVPREILPFMPQRLHAALQETSVEKAVHKYTTPDLAQEGLYSEWESDLKRYSGDFMVWPSGYGNVYERSYHIMGWEELMTAIAATPAVVEEVMDKVTEYKIGVAKEIVRLGFKMAHNGDDFGTQCGGFFSNTMFRQIIIPRMKRIWKVFTDAGLPIMLHSCGDVMQYIPDLIDIGLTILEPCQPCMDLTRLKREFGKDIIFYGGIDTQTLPFLTPEQTKEMVRSTIRTLGKGGGYIIAASQEIMNDVPIANIKVLVETIREERARVLEQ